MEPIKNFRYPKCDFCPDEARYDGKTKMGPWAYMCEKHLRWNGVKGMNQKLRYLDKE